MPGSVLGSAVLNLTTDASKLKKGLKQAETDTDASVTRMQGFGDKIAAATPYVAIGAAAVGAGVAIKGVIDDVAALEKELRPHLGRTGLAAEELQLLKETASRFGAEDPLEGVTDSLQEFNLLLGENLAGDTNKMTKALDGLGISLEDLEGKSDLQKFDIALDALHEIEDIELRTFYADEIFGGAWENQAGLITASANAVARVREEVEETFNVLSEDEIKKLKDYNLAVDDFGNTWDGLKQDLVTTIAPALTGFFEDVTESIDDSKESFDESKTRISEWDDNFVEVVNNLATMVDGIETEVSEIPAVVGEYMTSEDMDLAGYFSDQKEPLGVSLAEVAEVAKGGAEGIASDFALELGAMGSAAHDAIFGGGAEGEGSMIGPSVADAFHKMPVELKKIIDQGFGETITPSWKSGLSAMGDATWDAFYGGAEGEGAIMPTFEKAFKTDIPAYITDAVPVITDEVDYLMQDGVQTPVEDGLEEAATLMEDGMSDLEEKVNSAVEPMVGAVTSYGETSIVTPITAAVTEAGTRVRTELAAIEAAAAATAEALRGFDSASVAAGVAGHRGFDSSQWERRNDGPGGRFGGDYYYNPTTGESISTRLYQSRRLAEAAAAHNRVLAGASDRDNPLAQEYFNQQGVPSLPGLPSMDSGGIVTGPTLAALAMNSRPEAVIPLSRLENMGMGGGRTVVHIENVYGFDDFADKVQEATLQGNRQGRQEVIYGPR